jgi:hypothetical protein
LDLARSGLAWATHILAPANAITANTVDSNSSNAFAPQIDQEVEHEPEAIVTTWGQVEFAGAT